MLRSDKEKYIAEKERRRRVGLKLSGDTWPVRKKIKDLDGMWDRVSQYWLMPDEQAILDCGGVKNKNGDGYEVPRKGNVRK